MVKQTKSNFQVHGPLLFLILMVIIFAAYSGYMALNLKQNIIPDEPAHFIFSKAFSTTPGMPRDTYETYSLGWYVEGNPFMFYWINGRLINLFSFLSPSISDLGLLVSLRVVNVLYSIGSVFFCFLLSKEVIQHRWWQLLPVFLLTNTLMFVFLSAGVQYDNLANLASMAGIYYLVRIFKKNNFLVNSLAWMICIAFGTLVKYPILPLALGIFISWLIFIIIHRKKVFPLKIQPVTTIVLLVILVPLIIGNLAIYGVNLIKYHSITRPCRKILTESQCELSQYERRRDDLALDPKLTIEESIKQGYPSPLRYAFVDWVYHMLMRSFGMVGHMSYFPLQLIPYYQALFYLFIILGLINAFLWQTLTETELNLFGIALLYILVLFITNYNSELVYGFKQIAVQGRYLFPIIGVIVVLFTKVLKETPIKFVKYAFMAFSIGLFFIGGPLTLLMKYDTILLDWFI